MIYSQDLYHFFVRLRQTLLTSFFVSNSWRRCANAVRFSFFFLVLKYGLAHLHTELVLRKIMIETNRKGRIRAASR